jgi:hypothetical protein
MSQDLRGRWQEVVRYNENDSIVAFSDTLRIHFTAKDSIRIQQKGTIAYIGRYHVYGSVISMEDILGISVISRSENEMMIKYEHYKMKLKPVLFFADERSRYDSVYIHYGNAVNIGYMKGKWFVYKKEGSMPEKGFMMLQKIYFGENGSGEVSRFNWEDGVKDSITFFVSNNILYLSSQRFKAQFTIMKAQPDEIILKDEKLTYYLKPSK